MPWEDSENRDPSVVAKIRILCILFVLIIVLTMVVSKGFPKVYYKLIGDYQSLNGWPIGSSILLAIYVILTGIYVLTSLATAFYQKKNSSFVDSTLPIQFLILPRMFLLIVSTILYGYIYFKMFGNGQLWFILQLLLTVTGILSPAYMISDTTPLWAYAKSQYEAATRFLRTCKPRSSQIEPIV